MKRHFSLRRRVSLIAFLLLLTTGIALLIFMQKSVERATESAYDRLLLASARTIANAVQTEDGRVVVEVPSAAFSMFSGDDRTFYVVRHADGSYVTGYQDLDAGLPLAEAANGRFDTISYHDEPIRIVTVGRLVAFNDATGWVTIRVAQTRLEQYILQKSIMHNEIIAIAALMVIALIVIWLGIGLTFSPLKKLENELHRRDPSDLSPLESPAPNEINALVIALNLFMARLLAASGRMRDLVADAAHQIRTPLASLRSQVEVAVHETDDRKRQERLLKIERSAIQASQLVSQLLMDATIAHRLEQKQESDVDIDILVDDVINRLNPDETQRVRVRMDAQTRNLRIKGDRIALREMLRNLIDNALRYSDLDVVMATMREGQWLCINIIDHGPGIDETERDLVLKRFQRGRNAGQSVGSGLGLPIAKQVAEAHGGVLDLSDAADGKGLRVEVRLPID